MAVIAVVWLPYPPADTILVLTTGVLSIANSSRDDETAQQCLPFTAFCNYGYNALLPQALR